MCPISNETTFLIIKKNKKCIFIFFHSFEIISCELDTMFTSMMQVVFKRTVKVLNWYLFRSVFFSVLNALNAVKSFLFQGKPNLRKKKRIWKYAAKASIPVENVLCWRVKKALHYTTKRVQIFLSRKSFSRTALGVSLRTPYSITRSSVVIHLSLAIFSRVSPYFNLYKTQRTPRSFFIHQGFSCLLKFWKSTEYLCRTNSFIIVNSLYV